MLESHALNNTKPLLEVKGLKTYFYTEDGVVKSVDGVDFTVRRHGGSVSVSVERREGKVDLVIRS